jgi:hypothetical protein
MVIDCLSGPKNACAAKGRGAAARNRMVVMRAPGFAIGMLSDLVRNKLATADRKISGPPIQELWAPSLIGFGSGFVLHNC